LRTLQRWILSSLIGSLTVVGLMPLQTEAMASQANVPERAPGKVLALIKQLDSKEDNVRLIAVVALGELGREARAATPALIEVVKTGNEDLRLNACLALGRIGKDAVAPLVRLVNDKDPGVRFCAVWTLGLIGPDARSTTGAVVGALKDKDDGVRRKAAYTLKRIDPDLQAAAPALIAVLGDSNTDVREEAAEAIKRFGAKAVPFLAQAIRESASVRAAALAVLNQIPADADTLVAAFAPLLCEKDLAVQQVACDVLIRQGKAAIPRLLPLLKDKDLRVRLEGLRLLTTIPADSALMLGQLKLLAADKAPALRESALVLLGRLGPEGVPHLIGALTDQDAGVRWTAVFSLGEMGAAAKSAVPALTRADDDADPDVRAAVKEALQKIGGNR
jgi:HEAT repeat protein